MSLPFSTGAHTLKLDAAAIARATALIATCQTAYNNYVLSNPSAPPETIDAGDVCTMAVQEGLNYFTPIASWQSVPTPQQPTIDVFTPHAGTGVSSNGILVWDETVTEANAIIAALGGGIPLAAVLGCMCATGLALMSSLYTLQGPFT